MSLVVGENSYITLDYAEEYFTTRGIFAQWVETNEQMEAAIVKATDYLESKYSGKWKGDLFLSSQALSWPRKNLLDLEGRIVDGVPDMIKKAVCELALKARSEELCEDLDYGGLIKRKKVGPIETEYYKGVTETSYHVFVENQLKPFLQASSFRQKLVRT